MMMMIIIIIIMMDRKTVMPKFQNTLYIDSNDIQNFRGDLLL